MREGWTYKKLGEVCSFIGGGTPSKNVSKYYCGNIPWATVRDMTKFKLDTTELKITQEAVENSATNVLPKGMIVISTHVGLGKICELMQDTAINQDLKGADLDTKVIDKYYFCYWYKSQTDYIASNATGATVKGVTLKFIQGMDVALPPLSIQQLIVSELDLISHILDQKRQQLKEYDALAESIFFDMFGDPVENQKGWEVKKVSELGIVKIGPFGSLLHASDYISDGTPLVNPIHMKDGHIMVDKDFTVSKEKAGSLSNYLLKENDIILARRGDIGRCAVVSAKENGYICGTGSLFIRPIDDLDSVYSTFLVQAKSMKDYLVSQAQGVTMLNINCKIVEDLLFPLPPLPLQREFAAKIESIEQQKQLLKESIKETEMLFQSRMDYWFNG